MDPKFDFGGGASDNTQLMYMWVLESEERQEMSDTENWPKERQTVGPIVLLRPLVDRLGWTRPRSAKI